MSDAPETIWATSEWGRIDQGKWWDSNPGGDSKEYRSADLPATDAQIKANPKVQALVEALERIAHASDIYGVESNAEDQGADTLAYAHKSTCNLARAAIAALENPDE